MSPSYRFYRGCYVIVRLIFAVFCRLDITGKQNIPEGPVMICANHSNASDPFFVAFAFGIEHHMHIIAKIELFRIPVLSAILKKLGMIAVDRGMSDISTIRNALNYLKKGEKVVIFPEGTRVTDDDAVNAKRGAIWLAERAGVPIVPVFIPRRKRLFRKISLVIGAPYRINEAKGKRSTEDYVSLSNELMGKIKELSPALDDEVSR